ncbi:hypothetical protein Csa_004253 [Cucumis sativus]|uniref:Uncharacterized protein n=1 Tax=Cucumis sativus TaxID=3659 RepID=A0A0A0KJK7_CUCSA|nr:hypothetical protein Csa_004253 [Cucumis sativus]
MRPWGWLLGKGLRLLQLIVGCTWSYGHTSWACKDEFGFVVRDAHGAMVM